VKFDIDSQHGLRNFLDTPAGYLMVSLDQKLFINYSTEQSAADFGLWLGRDTYYCITLLVLVVC